MTMMEMMELKKEYGPEMMITKSVHMHDEDEDNKYVIIFKDVIVGSELVSKSFVRQYIADNVK